MGRGNEGCWGWGRDTGPDQVSVPVGRRTGVKGVSMRSPVVTNLVRLTLCRHDEKRAREVDLGVDHSPSGPTRVRQRPCTKEGGTAWTV